MVTHMNALALTKINKKIFYVFFSVSLCASIIFGTAIYLIVKRSYKIHKPAFSEVSQGSATGLGISGRPSNFIQPFVAISPNGNPYIAWTELNRNGLHIVYWDGAIWHQIGTESLTISNNNSPQKVSRHPVLAFTNDGLLYLAWDQANSIHIAKWDGHGWHEVGDGSIYGNGITSSGDVAQYPSLATSADGSVYLAWQHYVANKPQISVKRWDGDNWVYVLNPYAKEEVFNKSHAMFIPKIAINSEGTLYLFWTEGSSYLQSYHVAQWNGVDWTDIEHGTKNTVIGYTKDPFDITWEYDGYVFYMENLPSFSVAPNNDLYIAWPDDLTTIAVRHLPFGYTNWTMLDYKATFDTPPDPVIITGPDNMAYLVWQGKIGFEFGVYALYWNGSSWQEVIKGSGHASGIGKSGSLLNFNPAGAVAPDNTIYIAWEVGSFNQRYIYIRHKQP